MNLLLQPLPEVVAGKKVNTDFRVMIGYEALLQNDVLSEEKRLRKALESFYQEMPEDLIQALEGLHWFYRCGKPLEEKKGGSGSNAIAYDFQQDAPLLLADFQKYYDIDLTREQLHWWKFSAFLLALPGESAFMTVVQYRTADTRDMPKKMKQFYESMKVKYAIKPDKNKKKMTLEERDRAFKADMDRKYRRAMAELEKCGEK